LTWTKYVLYRDAKSPFTNGLPKDPKHEAARNKDTQDFDTSPPSPDVTTTTKTFLQLSLYNSNSNSIHTIAVSSFVASVPDFPLAHLGISCHVSSIKSFLLQYIHITTTTLPIHNASPVPSPVHLYSASTSRRQCCCSARSSGIRPRTCCKADLITLRKFR